MQGRSNLTVALVRGGRSAERAVSLKTSEQCAAALNVSGYKVIEIDADKKLLSNLSRVKPDVIFNALHGRWGEDGIVQGCFEWLEIPYTHSGVLASALAMNKQKAREVFQRNGLPVARGSLVKSSIISKGHPMSVPYVIKPNNEGSSVGVTIILNEADNLPIIEHLPETILVEEFIPGRELTVTILDDKPLALTEIISPVWYDYKAKYQSGGSEHVLPALVPTQIKDACYSYALAAHKALGCRGVTRVDLRWNDDQDVEGLFLLELNTQPGMTTTSLVPEQAKACGISFENLCKWLVEDASCLR
mgnify:CR=1 FL=1